MFKRRRHDVDVVNVVSVQLAKRVGGAIAGLALSFSAAVAVQPADACSCASPPGKVVLAGTSEDGVKWQISAQGDRRSLVIHYEVDLTGEPDGAFSQFRKPIPRALLLSANTGGGWGPDNESDLMGVTAKRVHRLDVRMSDGSTIAVSPARPPERLREKHAWARDLRFFALFHDGDVEPKRIAAFDRDGVVLDSVGRSRYGFFSFGEG